MKKLLFIVLAFTLPLACLADATVPPPVISMPAVTNWITVTNLVPVVSTSATIRVFTVLIDTNQQPVVFMTRMSDGSEIVAKATAITALGNPLILGDFNTLLAQIVANGRRIPASTNRIWTAHQ